MILQRRRHGAERALEIGPFDQGHGWLLGALHGRAGRVDDFDGVRREAGAERRLGLGARVAPTHAVDQEFGRRQTGATLAGLAHALRDAHRLV